MPAVPTLPIAPHTSRPETFAPESDAFFPALQPWADALVALANAFALGLASSSTTSLALGTGAKALSVDPGKGYIPGMDIVVASTATPTDRMLGTVTTYDVVTGALVVEVYSATGTGTFAAWSVSMTSAVDATQFVTPAGVQELSNKTIVSPALTGTPTSPTAAPGTNTTQVASTAFVEAAVASKANSVSPALTGTPTSPTAAPGTNTTQIASTAFVVAALANLVASSPAALDTLNELAAALGNDANFATTVTNALAAKAPLASPALTGAPTAPTAAAGTDTTQLANTAFVLAEQLGGRAKLTAQGAISAGQTVVINANGTISAVAATDIAGAIGSEQVQVASNVTMYDKVLSIPGTDKVVIMYTGFIVVGTVAGGATNTLTLGTPVAFAYADKASMCWHETDGVLIVGYNNTNAYIVVGTISGTTLTLGTPSNSGAAAYSTNKVFVAYNSHQNKVLCAYVTTSTAVSARAVHVAAGVVTWYTAITTNSGSGAKAHAICPKPGTPYTVLATYDSTNGRKAYVLEINASTTSNRSNAVVYTSGSDTDQLSYNAAADRFLLGSGGYQCNLLTVSGSTVTASATITVLNGVMASVTGLDYDSPKGKWVLVGNENSTNYIVTYEVAVSGSTITLSAPVYLNTTYSYSGLVAYNAAQDRAVGVYRDDGNSLYGTSRVWDTGDTTTSVDDWIGMAAAAIADTAQGWVNLKGGVCTAVSGLTTGYTYYLDDYGVLQQSGSRLAGVALSASKLLITGNA